MPLIFVNAKDKDSAQVRIMDADGDALILTLHRDGSCNVDIKVLGKPATIAEVIDMAVARSPFALPN